MNFTHKFFKDEKHFVSGCPNSSASMPACKGLLPVCIMPSSQRIDFDTGVGKLESFKMGMAIQHDYNIVQGHEGGQGQDGNP